MKNLVIIEFWQLGACGMGKFRSFCTYHTLNCTWEWGVGEATFFYYYLMGEESSFFLPRGESSQKCWGYL